MAKSRSLLDTNLQEEPSLHTWPLPSAKVPQGRGRPPKISDEELIARRDLLAGLLSSRWAEFAWELLQARTADDVGKAFGLCADTFGQRRVLLWHQPLEASTVSEIAKTRSDLRTLSRELSQTRSQLRQTREQVKALEEASDDLSRRIAEARKDGDPRRLEEANRFEEAQSQVAGRLKQQLSRETETEGKVAILDQRQKHLASLLQDREAFFCQSEILRFLKAGKYHVTPVSLANACAGLPDIGWRQSFKRCQKVPDEGLPGMQYLVVQRIGEVLRRKHPNSTEEGEAVLREYVTHLPGEPEDIGDYLRENWWYLRTALQQEWDLTRPRSLPFRIAAAFSSAMFKPQSPYEKLLAEQERLPRPSRKREIPQGP